MPQEGRLPLDFCGEDDAAREFSNIENLDYPDPEIEAAQVVDYVQRAHRSYDPVSFWDYQQNFVQMLVEKIGLKNLSRRFAPDTMCLSAMVVVPHRSGSASAF